MTYGNKLEDWLNKKIFIITKSFQKANNGLGAIIVKH